MNAVTEMMLPIEGPQLNCRLWVDVTDLIDLHDERLRINSRRSFMMVMAQEELTVNDTLMGLRHLIAKLGPLQFVNAFEVTDKLGVGFIHYFNWP